MDNLEKIQQTQNSGQNMPNQPPGYVQQGDQHSYYHGPSIGSLLVKSRLSKIGLVLIILSVIGLIISYAVPWGYVDADGIDERMFGHDLENKDGQDLASILGSGSSSSFEDTTYDDYIEGTPVLADIGFLLLLVFGIVILILGLMESNQNIMKSLLSFIGFIIGVIALIPSLWTLIAGIRFIGYNIYIALNGDIYSDKFIVFPAAYIILTFGFLCFIAVILLIKGKNKLLNMGIFQNPVSSRM
ncbi:MAG: hypothetical protein KAW45_00085 [Thermoplasmatales archaeon]|nr:hypothetical protein [Thermoplasmatales archaeon]